MKKTFFYILTAGMICLTACGKQSVSSQNESLSKSFFAMDTYMTITVYGENAETALNQVEERVTELEKSGLLQMKTVKFMQSITVMERLLRSVTKRRNCLIFHWIFPKTQTVHWTARCIRF